MAQFPEEQDQEDADYQQDKIQDRFRILVVDDDENVREVLADLLLLEGHEVFLADDGEKAIHLFQEKKPDLIITDLGMPGISGWEVSRQAKAMQPEIKVIVISGWGATLEKDQLERNYVDQVLPKPFHLDQVKNTIAEVMSAT